MNLRIVTGGRYRLKEDGPARFIGQTFHEIQIVARGAGGLGYLHEPFITTAQHACEVEDILVAHRVGDHRRTVEVGLRRVGTETLNRESAKPSIHPFV